MNKSNKGCYPTKRIITESILPILYYGLPYRSKDPQGLKKETILETMSIMK